MNNPATPDTSPDSQADQARRRRRKRTVAGAVFFVVLALAGVSDAGRDASVIVVVEDVSDLWALERAGAIDAKYHVLGGVLSPLDGVGPSDLSIAPLVERCRAGGIREVVLAVNATVEGQTTAHYITAMLKPKGITVTRIARGVPVGGELEYVDSGTLAQALRERKAFAG